MSLADSLDMDGLDHSVPLNVAPNVVVVPIFPDRKVSMHKVKCPRWCGTFLCYFVPISLVVLVILSLCFWIAPSLLACDGINIVIFPHCRVDAMIELSGDIADFAAESLDRATNSTRDVIVDIVNQSSHNVDRMINYTSSVVNSHFPIACTHRFTAKQCFDYLVSQGRDHGLGRRPDKTSRAPLTSAGIELDGIWVPI
jgi:hypothetical protein